MLRDRLKPGLTVLFVGINPGQRSEAIGHHFAGYSNRFWPLLYDSKLVPERIRAEDDDRLAEWGLGITNLVPRMTPGIVALVGVTLFRSLFNRRSSERVSLGLQAEELEGARVFVLPNPSGRNANFSYDEMLASFRALRRAMRAR